MQTINVSDKTKQRFLRLKLKLSAKKGHWVSEDELTIILLDKFGEGVK